MTTRKAFQFTFIAAVIFGLIKPVSIAASITNSKVARTEERMCDKQGEDELTPAQFETGVDSACDSTSRGDTSSASSERADDPTKRYFFKAPTLGGRYFWTDLINLSGYRLQTHAWYDQHRLIDPKGRLEAWGSRQKCERQLEVVKRREGLQPVRGKVVIVLHGLGRTHGSMTGLANELSQRLDDWTVINWNYASTRESVSVHAEHLASLVDHLPEADEISFVGHSLGNIVVRRYLHDLSQAPNKATESFERTRNRIGRVVMLAPPNQGSRLARFFRRNPIFHAVWGSSGKELSVDWERLEATLATPTCEFGIIAGGTGNKLATNPILNGNDDLIVAVEETKLAGAADFRVVPAAHTWIMNRTAVRDSVVTFLQHGYFESAETREPILNEGVEVDD